MTSATLPMAAAAKPSALRPGRILLYVVLTVGALLMITPFLWMLMTAFKSNLEIAKFSWLPSELRWRNFVEAMQTAPFLRYFRNSLFIAVGETAFTLAVLGLVLASVTGWIGGELVTRLGVGVDAGAHLNASSSLSGLPATQDAPVVRRDRARA